MTSPDAPVSDPVHDPASDPPRRRADAARNRKALLDAAAAAFVAAGIDAPVRDIAARAGVGTGTIYRHYPTRADLVVAVYRHQIEECAQAGPALLAGAATPFLALRAWIDLFVDFLVTKHGLAAALRNDREGFVALHGLFLERLLPVLADLLRAAQESGELRPELEAYELMRAVGNLCAGSEDDPAYDAGRMVMLLLSGCRADGPA